MASTDDQLTTSQTPDAEATSAAASGPGADDTASAKASAKAPARKRAPRRATAKAAAPAPAAAAEPTGPAPSAEAAAPDGAAEPAAGEAAPAKRARKAAARKSPAKKAATTKAGSRKAAKAAATTEPVTAEAHPQLDLATGDGLQDAEAAAVATTGEAAADTTDLEELADEATAEGETADEGEDAATPAPVATVPDFGLLFQAPDTSTATTARRRRTASRPEMSPRPEETQAAAEQAEPADTQREQPEEGDAGPEGARRRRRRGGKGRGRGRGPAEDSAEAPEPGEGQDEAPADEEQPDTAEGSATGTPGDTDAEADLSPSTRRRRRRRRSGGATEGEDPPGTVTRVREPRRDEVQSVKGSTRLEAKKQRRREGREAGRRRTIITEAEFLARRESVERVMVVREREGRTQIGVLEDGVLVEHYVSRETNASMAGNVYLGRVQNVLPSMEAAFVDIGKGRNAVLYAGEVNWDAAGLETNQPKRIENALKSGDSVLVQVTKDPIGHKGARLTSQISLPGRYLVYVPEGSMTGISRKLPDTERARLKGILKEVVPDTAGVIVRTAAEGASEEELRADVQRLTSTWDKIQSKAKAKASNKSKGSVPALVHGEPDLTVRVIRDVFNEDFSSLVVSGRQAWEDVSEYLGDVAPDLAERLQQWTSEEDLFTHYRVDEQIAKAMDRKVWLPSGGSLVIDRTEAMTVIDVNTGKFVGSGGNLEETVTKNNIEAAEEIVRQLRLRDIGGIIVIDFIDMVLESNRDLVVRRLLECLGRDRTKHQVAEVTSLGLVQMTRKRVGSGLIEVFSETCEHCGGRGIIIHTEPVDKPSTVSDGAPEGQQRGGGRSRRGRSGGAPQPSEPAPPVVHGGPTPAQIAAAAHAAALKSVEHHHDDHADARPDSPLEVEVEPVSPVAAVVGAVEESTAPDLPGVEQPAQPAEPGGAVEVDVAPQATPQPAQPAPRRRKRGRVVAPAGPPRHAEPEDSGAAS